MAERPILFSGPMVRAIIDGRKTQTRRAVKHIPWRAGCNPNFSQARPFANAGVFHIAGGEEMTTGFRCPYGQPGDRLWVRETWMDLQGTGIYHTDPVNMKTTRYAYGADSPPGSASDECRKDFGLKWRPSIHMPRAACRLVLEITGVRIERLRAISEADAIAGGVERFATTGGTAWMDYRGGHGFNTRDQRSPQRSFESLWASINGQASWDANPWVWVVEFKPLAAERGEG